ncbi:MAG: hypothetical protein ACT4TC_18015 [Myxococcaceae bacterium]
MASDDKDLALRALNLPNPGPTVPVGYAEKTMATLMQMHSEMMDEKERRMDVYRRLAHSEQTVAELRTYIQILEERLALAESVTDPKKAAAVKPPPTVKPARAPDTEELRRTGPAPKIPNPFRRAAEATAAAAAGAPAPAVARSAIPTPSATGVRPPPTARPPAVGDRTLVSTPPVDMTPAKAPAATGTAAQRALTVPGGIPAARGSEDRTDPSLPPVAQTTVARPASVAATAPSGRPVPPAPSGTASPVLARPPGAAPARPPPPPPAPAVMRPPSLGPANRVPPGGGASRPSEPSRQSFTSSPLTETVTLDTDGKKGEFPTTFGTRFGAGFGPKEPAVPDAPKTDEPKSVDSDGFDSW